jgi:hypothetical protein
VPKAAALAGFVNVRYREIVRLIIYGSQPGNATLNFL